MVTRQHPEFEGASQINQLINGGFRIWQRGSGPFTTSAVYSADKWKISSDNVVGGSDLPNNSEVDQSTDTKFGDYAIRVRDDDTNGRVFLNYSVENGISNLAGQTITVSVWVKEGPNQVSDNAILRLYTFDGSGDVVESFDSVNPGSSWERLVATIGVPSDATNSVSIELMPASDSSLTGTPTGEVIFDGVTLTVGPDPVDYPQVVRPIGQEESLAQRYYEDLSLAGAQLYAIKNASDGSPRVQFYLPFSERKASVPTVTQNIDDVTTQNHGDGSAAVVDDTANWSFNTFFGDKNLWGMRYDRDTSTTQELADFDVNWEAEVT